MACGLLACLVTAGAAAQEGAEETGQVEEPAPEPYAFSSDRPGFWNTTQIAPQLGLISELSVTMATDEEAGTRAFTLLTPTARLRTGVLEWLELRIDLPSFSYAAVNGSEDAIGLDDMVLAVKLATQLTENVRLALIPSLSLPTGSALPSGARFGAADVRARVGVNLEWDMPGGLWSAYHLSVDTFEVTEAPSGTRLLEGVGNVAFGYTFIERLALFLQGYVLLVDGLAPRGFVGGGFTVQVTDRVQIDLFYDQGVTEDDSRSIFGFGTTVGW
jgi:hypothetical protein